MLHSFKMYDYLMRMNAEIEFLEQLVKNCRAMRDPKRPRSRTEMAIPAAQWEMKFEARLRELEQQEAPKPELQEQAA